MLVQGAENTLFDRKVLKGSFNNEIDLCQVSVVTATTDQREALLLLNFVDTTTGQHFVVARLDCFKCLVQFFLVSFNDHHLDILVGKTHGDATTHGAATDDGGGSDFDGIIRY